ncbi:MAG: hypothetical protein OXU42_09815 [Deltaproteobacteria bacterium]|nr:hypothetical protein [Deltaproteobacteria bacterium]
MGKRKKDHLAEGQQRLAWLRQLTDEAIAARAKEMEFHGLEEELRSLQRALQDSYERSKAIKHPRDKGDQREEILRHFFTSHGLLPKSIHVPSTSTRMVSPSGHISPELDILFTNATDSIVLKRFKNTLEYYPVESVLGTIQVKSRLTKKELRSGLTHIQHFKSIRPTRPIRRQMGSFTMEAGLNRRFGVVFSYERALRWEQMVEIIEEHLAECPNGLWPNMVVVLDAGCFFIGDNKRYAWDQKVLEDISDPIVHGVPDNTGHCLQQFYSILIWLLRNADAGLPNTDDYLRMPMVVGEHSIEFVFGAVSEFSECARHGRYLKKFTLEKVNRILNATRDCEPINCLKALDLAAGKPGTDIKTYERQPGDTTVYDPDALGFENLLLSHQGYITYEQVVIDGRRYWLPWHYVAAHELIEPCPSC